MKKIAVLLVFGAALLSSCGTYTGEGAYLGGGAGAVLGSAIGGIAGGRGVQSHGRAENSPVARSSALVGSLPAPCDERACGVFLGAEGVVGALEFSIRDDTASWLRYKSDWGLPLLSLRTPGKRVPVRGRIACSSALKAGSGSAANSPRNCLHTICQSDSASHPTCIRP